MEFLSWLEQSGLSTWVRESSSIWGFPTLLTLHTLGMGLLVGTLALVDLRILGVAPLIPLRPMESCLRVMWWGFWVNVLSGTVLFAAGATRHVLNPAFYIKMTCIAFGVWNVRVLRRQVFGDSANIDRGPVPRKGKILAGASLALWTGAITAGRLMAYGAFGKR